MLGLNNDKDTPSNLSSGPPLPSNDSTLMLFGQAHDVLPFVDDTQALFNQVSWQYAVAHSGSVGLGWDWVSGALGAALARLSLGLGWLMLV
jgi:hypothetical protein